MGLRPNATINEIYHHHQGPLTFTLAPYATTWNEILLTQIYPNFTLPMTEAFVTVTSVGPVGGKIY
jgi:hypothetical protein